MGAVAEIARGPIEEVTRIRFGLTPEAAEAERIHTMHQTFGELEPALAQPVYEGDVETALIHHMGRAAFGINAHGSDQVRGYISFAKDIDADTAEGPTPVLVMSQIRRGQGSHGNTETALVMVDPEKPTFRSSVVHERDVKESGYADKIARTRRSIELVGETSTIHADLSGYGHDQVLEIHEHADWRTQQSGLVLSQRSVIDGKNGRKPVSVEHDDFSRDIDRMGWSSPTYLVGWKAISGAFEARVYNVARGYNREGQSRQNAFPYILNFRSFLEQTGQLEVLLKHSAPLKKIFKHAVGLEESIAALAPPERDED